MKVDMMGTLRRVGHTLATRSGVVVGVLAVGVLAYHLGFMAAAQTGPPATSGNGAVVPVPDAQPDRWVCPMNVTYHAYYESDKAGQCAYCKMALVPAKTGTADAGTQLRVSDAARALMDVRTWPVRRQTVHRSVRLVGKVAFDETRLAQITAWVAGRIDRLFVDYTYMPIRKGYHMAQLYSPELYAAQEELLQAVKTAAELAKSDVPLLRERARTTLTAARTKLRLLGMNAGQVGAIEEAGAPQEHVTIHAPISGIVISRAATEGMYVKTGTQLYTIADLTRLWIQMEAYESDLAWLSYGQKLRITTDAYPGEEFDGWIAFISPVLDVATRTVRVRANVANPTGRLKPEMLVHATVTGPGPAMSGKWVCPMHPEVVADEKALCRVCGMDMERAESLGYVDAADKPTEPPLVVPAAAVLWTGKRSLVYVELPDAEEPTFEPRTVTLGLRAGDYYIVRDGVQEGDLVVVNGNFKIDSALQLRGLPSMMSPDGGAPPVHQHGGGGGMEMKPPTQPAVSKASPAFQKHMRAVWQAYQPLQKALAADDLKVARTAAAALDKLLRGGLMPTGPGHMAWMAMLKRMTDALTTIAEADDLGRQRAAFEIVSDELTAALAKFGAGQSGAIYRVVCPMAFQTDALPTGRKAHWLQSTKPVRNPYWGAAMLECGQVVETLVAPSGTENGAPDDD
jgi:membrane fusion protein, copper/silver efflux system